jgi:hypothetical protein
MSTYERCRGHIQLSSTALVPGDQPTFELHTVMPL